MLVIFLTTAVRDLIFDMHDLISMLNFSIKLIIKFPNEDIERKRKECRLRHKEFHVTKVNRKETSASMD